MFHYFIDLFVRTTHYFLAILGTSLLGFFIPAILSAAGITAALARVFRLQGWRAVLAHWQRSLSKSITVALVVGSAVYTPIFLWSLVNTMYGDHLQNENLKTENQQLRKQIGSTNVTNENSFEKPVPPTIVVSQEVISKLRRLNAEGSLIGTNYALQANKKNIASKYADWLARTTQTLDTKVGPSYGKRFKNATAYSGGCPGFLGVDDCEVWQEILGKTLELQQILSVLRTE